MKLTYEEWMAELDKKVQAVVGCSASDLSDHNYRDWYDDGMTSAAAAGKALEEEGYSL